MEQPTRFRSPAIGLQSLLESDMIEWCEQHIGARFESYDLDWVYGLDQICFVFREQEDLAQFVLTWTPFK